MAVIENRFVCDISKPVQAQALKGNVFSLDNLGSRISVLIYDNGQPATISGSVTANCILPDGSTVNVNGGLTSEGDSSKAYVDIPQSCLLIPGILKIAIKCTSSSVITTLAAIVANVYMTKTDNVITPSQQIITDWNAEISASLANQDAEISEIKNALYYNCTPYNLIGEEGNVYYPVYIKSGEKLKFSTADGNAYPSGSSLTVYLCDASKASVENYGFSNNRGITVSHDIYFIKLSTNAAVHVYGAAVRENAVCGYASGNGCRNTVIIDQYGNPAAEVVQ